MKNKEQIDSAKFVEQRNQELNDLAAELTLYQTQFGTDFGIQEMLMVRAARSMSKLTNAINNLPKKIRRQISNSSLVCGLEDVADELLDVWHSLDCRFEANHIQTEESDDGQ